MLCRRLVLMLMIFVASCGGGEDARDFRALADLASRPPSTTTTTTTTAATTTAATPPATVLPEPDQSDPGAPSQDECQEFLNEVLSAGRPPSSGETQYLYEYCGIDINDYYPPPTTEIGLTPGGPCELGSHRDCIDPDGDGIGTYLLGGGDCIAQLPDSPGSCADLDLDGVAGYPDSG